MNAIQQEVERLNLAEAISFFAVTVHRNERGEVVPTVTIFADGATEGRFDQFDEHLRGIADLLRKAYMPNRDAAGVATSP